MERGKGIRKERDEDRIRVRITSLECQVLREDALYLLCRDSDMIPFLCVSGYPPRHLVMLLLKLRKTRTNSEKYEMQAAQDKS